MKFVKKSRFSGVENFTFFTFLKIFSPALSRLLLWTPYLPIFATFAPYIRVSPPLGKGEGGGGQGMARPPITWMPLP